MNERDLASPDATLPEQAALPALLAVGLGILAALFLLPAWLPGISASFVGAEPKALWYLSRASGFVAFDLLWLSMALGLAITNKLGRLWPGGPAAVDLHQHVSVLGLALAIVHPLVLLGPRYSVVQLLVPFASGEYRPFWVGVGQVGLLLLAVITASYAARRRLGHRRWRLLHYLTFPLYVLVLLHGIASGTDSGTTLATVTYWASAGSLLFLAIYRALGARTGRTQPAPAGSHAS
jgi:predicted ferric reductase